MEAGITTSDVNAQGRLAGVLAHEYAHALGEGEHASDPLNLMFDFPKNIDSYIRLRLQLSYRKESKGSSGNNL